MRELEKQLHDRDRDPQHAAGGARRPPPDGVLQHPRTDFQRQGQSLGRARGVRADGAVFEKPQHEEAGPTWRPRSAERRTARERSSGAARLRCGASFCLRKRPPQRTLKGAASGLGRVGGARPVVGEAVEQYVTGFLGCTRSVTYCWEGGTLAAGSRPDESRLAGRPRENANHGAPTTPDASQMSRDAWQEGGGRPRGKAAGCLAERPRDASRGGPRAPCGTPAADACRGGPGASPGGPRRLAGRPRVALDGSQPRDPLAGRPWDASREGRGSPLVAPAADTWQDGGGTPRGKAAGRLAGRPRETPAGETAGHLAGRPLSEGRGTPRGKFAGCFSDAAGDGNAWSSFRYVLLIVLVTWNGVRNCWR
jgi:hypothetical protein